VSGNACAENTLPRFGVIVVLMSGVLRDLGRERALIETTEQETSGCPIGEGDRDLVDEGECDRESTGE
jgi:hypothetical protein